MIIGELLGRYFNDWVMNWSIRRNNGVFIAENRLWYVELYIIPTVFLADICAIH